MNKDQKGFTLLELIMVVAILGVLLGVAWPNLHKPLARYQLRSTAMQMAADMRWIRQQSIYGQATVVRLRIFKDEGTYQLRKGIDVTVRRSLPTGIRFHEVNLFDGKDTVEFTLTGAPRYAGSVVLSNAFGEKMTVFIMVSSGRIRMADG